MLTSARRPARKARGVVHAALLIAALTTSAAAQQLNPVYTDDSPVATETLARVAEFVASSNESEAIRELQKLLDEQPDRLVPAPGQPDVFVSTRSRVHAALLSSKKLLDLYREAETARAKQLLDTGETEAVERARLLTAPGFEAALRMAQLRMESSQFDAAYIALAQLEEHPDRRDPARAKDAAALMRAVARFVDRDDLRAHAQRWATESGLPGDAPAPVGLPASLNAPRTSYDRPAGPLDSEGVPPRPLWTTAIEPLPVPLDSEDAMLRAQQSADETNLQLWILPTIVGDTVFINDGTFVAARDRFTLQPRWAIRPISDEVSADPYAARKADIAGRLMEDTCSVTIHGHTLVATMGIAQNGDREGDRATFGIDAGSGRILWWITPPRLDPQLDSATVRGPALIDGGTVILTARKQAQGRRITSFYLFGVALDSGRLIWVRPIASAGAIPWGRGEQRVHPAPILDRGIVYATDPLGVITAVEAATGRPVWVRRHPVPALGGGSPADQGTPWTWDAPLVRGDTLLTLSPDRSEVLAIDSRTGGVNARRPASQLGEPGYFLAVRDQLAAVSKDAVYFAPMDNIATGAVRKTNTFPLGIRARVVVSGDKLLVPRSDGIAVIDPASPGGDATVLRLDRLGNALPLDSQLLVIDSQNLHSYLTWTVAQRLLEERMAANPDDPEPAVTYTDLAYRSQHPEQIAAAADRALAAMDKSVSEGNRVARQRLFRVLRDMIESSQERWAIRPSTPAPQQPPRREQPGRRAPSRPQPVETPPLDLAVMGQVLERLGRAAATPDERVTYYMAVGRFRDAESRPALAAEAYQTVLADSLLAAASWRTQTAAVRADIEATRRIRQLVLDRGPGAYTAFEAEASRELASLGAGASTQTLERIARQYPAAAVSATAWARSADLHEAAGRMHASVAALREAMVAAETTRAAGSAIDPATLGGIAGALIVRLQTLDQFFAAAQLVSRVRAQYPGLVLSDHGQPIDTAAAERDLLKRLAAIQRFPRIGMDVKPDAQGLAGWTLMAPRSKEQSGRACEHVMMISPADGKVALWGVAGGAPEGAGHGGGASGLQMLWSRDYKGASPVLLRLDPDSVYLFWDKTDAGDGAVVERIGAVGGETRWRTEPFRSLFPADPNFDQRVNLNRNIIETPIDGAVRLTDVVASMDEQAFALVERSGRTAVFDLDSGKLLWNAATAVSQVHDVDVGGGAVVIGGAALPSGDRAGMTPIISVHDARTGVLMHNMVDLPNTVRWLRVADHGEQGAALIVATAAEIDSFDLVSAKPNWSIAGGAAFGSLDSWVFGDRLFVLDEHKSVWLASLTTGEMGKQMLETYEHLLTSGVIEGAAIGEGRKLTAFTTDRGVCVFDPTGKLVGIDSINGESDEGALLAPAISEGYFVTIETQPHQTEDKQSVHALSILDGKTAMLRASRRVALDMVPRRMVLLDGRILITAGNNTVVYSAPEADSK